MSVIANPTDIEDRLARGLVAILNADPGVQAITGRTTGNVVAWSADVTAALPVIAYQLVELVEIGGTGDNRDAEYQLTAIAEGNGARSMVAALLERIEQALTWAAFDAQGLDALVRRRRRRVVPATDSEASRGLARADLDLTIWITK